MIREPNASDSFHRGILSHISSLLLPQLTTASLLSSVFPHFFSVLSLSTPFPFPIPALIFTLVCWQRPGRPNCGVWRAPCVWSRDGQCQGGHTCSLLALCLAGCGAGGGDGWMGGWIMGVWWAWSAGMHSDLCLLMPCSSFAFPRPVWTCTDNRCVSCSLFYPVCPTENKDFCSFSFPFLTS